MKALEDNILEGFASIIVRSFVGQRDCGKVASWYIVAGLF